MKVKVLKDDEKDDFAKQYFFPSDFFTIGKEYTVLCMDFSNKDENYNNIFEQQFCYRYSVINDNGDKAYVFPENTEITDYSFQVTNTNIILLDQKVGVLNSGMILMKEIAM